MIAGFLNHQQYLLSTVVSAHRTGTHPKQPLPTGYNGIPFIVGQWDCLGCVVIFLDVDVERFQGISSFVQLFFGGG